MKKRIISMLLVIVMVLGMFPAVAAEDVAVENPTPEPVSVNVGSEKAFVAAMEEADEIHVTGSFTLTDSYVMPEGKNIFVESGAQLSAAEGVTLTSNGFRVMAKNNEDVQNAQAYGFVKPNDPNSDEHDVKVLVVNDVELTQSAHFDTITVAVLSGVKLTAAEGVTLSFEGDDTALVQEVGSRNDLKNDYSFVQSDSKYYTPVLLDVAEVEVEVSENITLGDNQGLLFEEGGKLLLGSDAVITSPNPVWVITGHYIYEHIPTFLAFAKGEDSTRIITTPENAMNVVTEWVGNGYEMNYLTVNGEPEAGKDFFTLTVPTDTHIRAIETTLGPKTNLVIEEGASLVGRYLEISDRGEMAKMPKDQEEQAAFFDNAPERITVKSGGELQVSEWMAVDGTVNYEPGSTGMVNIYNQDIRGHFPQLAAKWVWFDGEGVMHENEQFSGVLRAEYPNQTDAYAIFYACYKNGDKWVQEPVSAYRTENNKTEKQLTAEGPISIDPVDEEGYAVAFSVDQWDEEGWVVLNNEAMPQLAMPIRCDLGGINYFSEPCYDYDYFTSDHSLSPVDGRTVYVGTWLREDQIRNLKWFVTDGSNQPVEGANVEDYADITLRRDCSYDGQTVWEISVPAKVARANPNGFHINFTADLYFDDGSQEQVSSCFWFGTVINSLAFTTVSVNPMEGLQADDFDLLDTYVEIPVGSSITGDIYLVWYNWDTDKWVADQYTKPNWYVAEGPTKVEMIEENGRRHSVIYSDTDQEATIWWTNGHEEVDEQGNTMWMPNDSADYHTAPLTVIPTGAGELAGFFTEESFYSTQIYDIGLSPLIGTDLWFGIREQEYVVVEQYQPNMVKVNGEVVEGISVDFGESMPEPGKLYPVTITKEGARALLDQQTELKIELGLRDTNGTEDLSDDRVWSETYVLNLYTMEALGWWDGETTEVSPSVMLMSMMADEGEEPAGEQKDPPPATIDMDLLEPITTVAKDETLEGAIYIVWWDNGAWKTELFLQENEHKLWMNNDSFTLEMDEDSWATVTCKDAGHANLFWVDKNGEILGNCRPIRFNSTTAYLSLNRLFTHDGKTWYESDRTDRRFRTTPYDEYFLVFYLNWLDADGINWHRDPVIPTTTDSVEITPLAADQVEPGQPNGSKFVKISNVSKELWYNQFTLTGTVGEGEGEKFASMLVDVSPYTGSFYAKPEINTEDYLSVFTPGNDDNNVIYFGVRDEVNLAEIFAMDGWDENGDILYGSSLYESSLYELSPVKNQPNMVKVTLNMEEINKRGGAEVLVGFRFSHEPQENWDKDTWFIEEAGSIWVEPTTKAHFYTYENGEECPLGVDKYPLYPLQDTELWFAPGQDGKVSDVSWTWSGTEPITVKQQGADYQITVPQSTARALGNGDRTLTMTITYKDGTTKDHVIRFETKPALVWGEDPGDNHQISVTHNDHGLVHSISLRQGTSMEGRVYYVWYNDNPGAGETVGWKADCYSNDFLHLENWGSFEMYPMDDEGNGGRTRLKCVGQEGDSYLRWFNGQEIPNPDGEGTLWVPGDEVDEYPFPLICIPEPGYRTYFYSEANKSDEYFITLWGVDPFCDNVVYLAAAEDSQIQSVVFEDQAVTVSEKPDENGLWTVTISAEEARRCVEDHYLTATVTYTDGEVEDVPFYAQALNVMAWGSETTEAPTGEAVFALSRTLVMKPNDTLTGSAYFIWYNNETHQWIADAYANDYLRLEGEGVFWMENVPNGEDPFDDQTRLTCQGGGEAYLYWTNHTFDENDQVTGPRDQADYDTMPITLKSDSVYMYYHEVWQNTKGNWIERRDEQTGYNLTPADEPIQAVFYLRWLDENNQWQEKQLSHSELTVAVDTEEGVCGLVIEPVEDGVPSQVRLHTESFDQQYFISAKHGEETVTLEGINSYISQFSFFTSPDWEQRESSFIRRVETGVDTFYIIYKGENYNDFDVTYDDTRFLVESAGTDAENQRKILKVTVQNRGKYEEEAEFITTANGYNEVRTITIAGGGVDTSDWYLGHAYLESGSEGWFRPEEWETYSDFGEKAAASEHFLALYAVNGKTEIPLTNVWVEADDQNHITLDPIDQDQGFYKLQIKDDTWNEVITVSGTATLEDGTTVAVSDSFQIKPGGEAFYADAEPDLENYSNYISEFVADGKNNKFYLHLTPPEGWEIQSISTMASDGTHWNEGCEVLTGEPKALGDNIWEFELNPEQVRQRYSRSDFRVSVDVNLVNDENGENVERTTWCPSIQVRNRIPYLSFTGIHEENGTMVAEDWRGEQRFTMTPEQQMDRLFFWNCYDEDQQQWVEFPVDVWPDQGYGFLQLSMIRDEEDWEYDDFTVESHRIRVDEDTWGNRFILERTEGNYTARVYVEVRREDVGFYSSIKVSNETYLNHLTVNDLSTGNIFYLAAELPEGQWIEEIETEGWENADLITSIEPTSVENVWKVTMNRTAIKERFPGGHGFNLQINLILTDGQNKEDGSLNVWNHELGIWVENHLPYLELFWVDGDEEGHYVRWEEDPFTELYMWPEEDRWVYGRMVYFGKTGERYVVPVNLTASGLDGVTIRSMEELEYPVHKDEPADKMYRVTSPADSWDQSFTLSAAADGHRASIPVQIELVEDAAFYSTDTISCETAIRGKNVQADNKVLWLGVRRTDKEGNLMLPEVYVGRNSHLITNADEDGKLFPNENGMFRIELDTQEIREEAGQGEAWIGLQLFYPDGEEGHVEFWARNTETMLFYSWLENEDGIWYNPEYAIREYHYSMRPGDEYFHLYGISFYDEANGWWVNRVPDVTLTVTEGTEGVLLENLERVVESQEPIKEAFYRVVATGDLGSSFTLTGTYTDDQSGKTYTADLTVPIRLNDVEFYKSATITPANWIRDFAKDPMNPTENVFYLAIAEGDDRFYREGSLNLEEDDSAAFVQVEDYNNYKVFRVTLTEQEAASNRDHHLNFRFFWEDAEGDDLYEEHADIYIYPGDLGDRAAAFRVNDLDVEFLENGTAIVWQDDQLKTLEQVGLEGLSYAYNKETDTGILTLDDAHLQSLEIRRFDYDHEQQKKIPIIPQNLTLNILGDSSISSTSFVEDEEIHERSALRVEGGVHLTIAGTGKLELTSNLYQDDAVVQLHGNDGGSLTIATTVKVLLQKQETESGSEGHLFAIHGNGYDLTVKNGGMLTTFIPVGVSRVGAIEGAQNLTIEEGGTLNTQNLNLHQVWDDQGNVVEGSSLNVAGLLNVTLLPELRENGEYHGCGVNVYVGTVNISGTVNVNLVNTWENTENTHLQGLGFGDVNAAISGNVTVDIQNQTAESGHTNGILIEKGQLLLTGGTTTLLIGRGHGLQVGTDGSHPDWGAEPATFTQSGGQLVIRDFVETAPDESNLLGIYVESCGTANFRGGSTTITGREGIQIRGTMNLRAGGNVTVNAPEKGDVWDLVRVNSIFGIQTNIPALNVYGGKLTVNGGGRTNCLLRNSGEYIQTGGAVILDAGELDYEAKGTDQDGKEYLIWPNLIGLYSEGLCWISGGSVTINAPRGIVAVKADNLKQEYFRLSNGTVTINSGNVGMITQTSSYLQGGKLTITMGKTTEEMEGAAIVVSDYNNPTGLIVSGGEHSFNGYVSQTKTKETPGMLSFAPVKFQGGVTTIIGSPAVMNCINEEIALEIAKTMPSNITIKDGYAVYSAQVTESGRAVEAVPYSYETRLWGGGESYIPVFCHTFINEAVEEGTEPVKSTHLTIREADPEEEQPDEPEVPVIPYSAAVEVTTSRITVGAPITVQTTVTVGEGTVNFELPAGLTLVKGSITVNGVEFDKLTDIPVVEAASIIFRVTASREDTYTIRCITNEVGVAEPHVETATFKVNPFQISVPTYTSSRKFLVRGTAAPDQTIILVIGRADTGAAQLASLNDDQVITVTTTSLGTFAQEVELQVEENGQAQTFTVDAYLDEVGETPSATKTVVYNPTSVTIETLDITNWIHDSLGGTVESTNRITYTSGSGVPQRNYYTYWPELKRFDFQATFDVPEGWILEYATVVVSYANGDTQTIWLQCEEGAGLVTTDRTEIWAASEELSGAPIDFTVLYRPWYCGLRPILPIYPVIPDLPNPPIFPDYPDDVEPVRPNRPGPNDPIEDPDSEDPGWVDPGVVVIPPIADPSGIVYTGSVENPIKGATVTLYYGGNGETADPANYQAGIAYDMTPYDQVNPQVTDVNGRYHWDVPVGWWKVVAVKDEFRAESEWLHVLPVQTDINLNLNLPTDGDTSYQMSEMKVKSITGEIPTTDFKVDIIVTNHFNEQEAVELLLATYDAEGKFLQMISKPVDLEQNVTTQIIVDVPNDKGDVAEVRAFLVDSMGNMTPLGANMSTNK